MSRYYIYKMNILNSDTYFGSYIGQHKISKRCPFSDGYKGSGSDWKKCILDKHIPVKKVILRICEKVEDANYWEDYYIESAKAQGIYLWNRYKGGGAHECGRIYTEEEIAEHHRQSNKQWYETNREHKKQYMKQYREANKERYTEYQKQWREYNKEKIAEQKKQYYEINKEQLSEQKKQYASQLCSYRGEIITMNALRNRFRRVGIEHPSIEAKKYLIQEVA